MIALGKISNNLWFWRIAFFAMTFVALGMFGMYVERPTKTVIKREHIYLIYNRAAEDVPAVTSRWM